MPSGAPLHSGVGLERRTDRADDIADQADAQGQPRDHRESWEQPIENVGGGSEQ